MSVSPEDKSAARAVKGAAREAGFDLARIATADELEVERTRYLAWIDAGRHGDMRWITSEWAERSSSPRQGLPGAESVISVGLAYRAGSGSALGPGLGRVARYAWGRDYHQVLGERLEDLRDRLTGAFGGQHRWYVDTGPAMDKAHAARSGLGWYGKNTNILTERFGSYVLLGEIITTLRLPPDQPLDRTCGSCRLCTAACPTGALGPDYSLDARRCISYLTIEHRGPIAPDLRPLMGSWVFGCDVCQDVCPPSAEPYLHSRSERVAWHGEVRHYIEGTIEEIPCETPAPTLPHLHPLRDAEPRATLDLLWLLRLTHAGYLEAFRGTAVRRAKVWMLRRNAAVALGNTGDAASLPALLDSAMHDEHPVVRGHAAWAIGRIGRRTSTDRARRALSIAGKTEIDPAVSEEIDRALDDLQGRDERYGVPGRPES